MGKDKKKNKKKADITVDELKKEYEDSIELLKAKHKQLDGMLQEVRLYIDDIKKMKEGIALGNRLLDDE